MKVYTVIFSVLLSITGNLHAEIYNYDAPGWDGYYIWAPRNAAAKVLEVNLFRYMTQKPGGSGELIVHNLLSTAAACGIGKVYWHLDNGEGRLLFPSQDNNSVLRWSNSEIDCAKEDYPRLALKKAASLDLDIYLLVSPTNFAEVQNLYPTANLVTEIPAYVPGVINEVDMAPETLVGSYIDQRAWYFRRDFNISKNIRSGVLAITAIEYYECYVNGVYIGANGSFDIAKIYDITSRLVVGENSIAVKVFPPSKYAGTITTNCAGLIVNANWFDSGGAHSLTTDKSWKCNFESVTGWYDQVFDSSSWKNASIVGYWGTFVYPYYRILRPDGLLKQPDNKIVLLDQNFEDQNIFRAEIGFDADGKGDSGRSIGLWNNPVAEGNYEPKVVVDNSAFSVGSRCVRLLKNATPGTGYLEGKRNNLAISGKFKLEFAIKPLDNVQFSCSALNSDDHSSINKIAIAHFDNQLYFNHNGSWVATGAQLSQNRWTQFRLLGDILLGTYDVYTNEEKERNWDHLGTASFDNTEISTITGIYIYPWNQSKRLFVDDIKLISLDGSSCDERLMAGEKVPGDVNRDCHVDFYDLFIITESWLNNYFD